MVKKPVFKLLANDKDITKTINANLINITFNDKAGNESDEINICIKGLYARNNFGDKLELFLGFSEDNKNKLFKCGSFNLSEFEKDYKAHTTTISATAINYASSNIKVKKSRSWENTTLGKIAIKIAGENKLNHKINSADNIKIKHEIQNNISDIEFIYMLCAKFNYLASIKNNTLILIEQKMSAQNGVSLKSGVTSSAKNREGMIRHIIHESDTSELSLQVKSRHTYSGCKISYQDTASASIKSVLVGSDNGSVYEMKLSQPKQDADITHIAKSKLYSLNRGSYEGSLTICGGNYRAGAELVIEGIDESAIFNILSVTHNFTTYNYECEIKFDG